MDNVKVNKGEPITLKITLTADPEPEVAWIQNGKELKADNFIELRTEIKELEYNLKQITYTFHIAHGRHYDTGDYTFKVKNKWDSNESNARVDVMLKPEIENFVDQRVEPFAQAIFRVLVMAHPLPKVTWTKDGMNLCNNDNCTVIADVEKETYTLIIESCLLPEHGTYTLTASNNLGETAATADCIVHSEYCTFL